MEARDLYWALYLSERDFIKHHEIQRTTVSNIIGAIAAGLIVASGSTTIEESIKITIASMLSVIGFFGFLSCGRLTSLLKLHGLRSYEYLKLLDDDIGNQSIYRIRKQIDKDIKVGFKFFSRIHLHKIWAIFHLFLLFTGLVLLWLHGGRELFNRFYMILTS